MLTKWKSLVNGMVLDYDNFWDFLEKPILGDMSPKKLDDGSFVVSLELPGIKESDLKVEVSKGMVKVSGESKTDTSSYAAYKSFSLPVGARVDKMTTSLLNGILTLTMPCWELPPTPEAIQIPISTK